ncbi:MAG: DUF1919 domain-containing protein [Clostridia bacterium]|nr:DUF1919 domain-containing protein [Clostridia bacterium]
MKRFLISIYKKTIGKINNKRIKNKDITIISNNCWGGIFYRNNNLEYLSPTLGLFFMAEDYIKFIYNLKEYIHSELSFISLEDSKHKEYLKKLNYKSPIGKINDIEIMFLHYENEQEALEKWERRKKRINWNKIIYKFSDQNMCTYEQLKKFEEFNAKNKICFTTRKYEGIDTIQLKKFEKCECVGDDIKTYKKYFNMYKFINNLDI